jgi:solute carrier family 25 (mitochondrial carnitine/acylcarnitine transporter), member 20/29
MNKINQITSEFMPKELLSKHLSKPVPKIEKKDDSIEAMIKHFELSFICGCLGGIVNVLGTHPLDTIKVRMQMEGGGIISCSKNMIAKEGFFSLYKGIKAPLYSIPAIYAFYFGSFELGKSLLGVSHHDKPTLTQSVIAGGFSGLVSTVVLSPIELVKCKLQMEGVGIRTKQPSALSVVKQVYKAEGIRGLYRGGLITTLREIPGNALYFGVYDYCRNKFKDTPFLKDPFWGSLFAGAMAGFVSWGTIYPQDIIKTKIQLDCGKGIRKYTNHPSFPDGGIMKVSGEIMKKSGYRGFTQGISACVFKGFVAEGLVFCTYEKAKLKLEKF